MNISFLPTLLLMMILFFSNGLTVATSTPPTHLLMVLQWSKAFCMERALAKTNKQCPTNYQTQLEDKFYVHGLWPKPGLDRLILEEYNLQVLVKLDQINKNRLLSNWRSALVDFNRMGEVANLALCSDFWAHEWKEHGQKQTLIQKEYFLFTLDIYDALSQIHRDVVSNFHRKPEARVVVTDIMKYIEFKHKVVVNISCLPYPGGSTYMLYEIYFNITLQGQLQNITDQGNLHKDPCPGNGKAVFI